MTGAEILLGLGLATSVLGTAATAKSQRQEADMTASLNEYNAQVADQYATMQEQQAAFNAGQIKSQNDRKIAMQRAAYGASGVTTEGSPIMVMADAEAQSEIDQLAERYEGAVEAQRSRSSAAGSRYQAQIARQVGKNKATGTIIDGFGKVLSGGMGFFGRGGSVG
jgi:hypothetical protein